jgi:protein-S-isoprenylcysteine O-methyltransferase Ste14
MGIINTNLIKSVLHNLGVVLVGFILAFIASGIDTLFGLKNFAAEPILLIGILLIILGFSIRVWATYYFYINKMKVIVLHTQNKLVTSGPFRFSRNPLYLGGNVFIFLGASLALGTPVGVIITILHLPIVDMMIRREETQLEKTFGKDWLEYKKKVHRWI